MHEYTLTITTRRPLPTMSILLDAACDELERRGFSPDGDYEATVTGPPELTIGMVMR